MKVSSPKHSPVIVSPDIDWNRDYSSTSLGELISLSPNELASVDPLVMNLLVAKGIQLLADISISKYQAILNSWVSDFMENHLPNWEPYFHEQPEIFRNDIRFFRLGMVSQYLEQELGIRYNLHQRSGTTILYTNPSDLFLNGVLDTRQGTCGNMSALHVAFGWRLGWPVSLACVNSHYILRFDDGDAIYNIEATQAEHGGFKSDSDEYLMAFSKVPAIAVRSGSDLRALQPHELLGSFLGLRARHIQDVGRHEKNETKILTAERDWLLARSLFPTNRVLFKNQLAISTLRAATLFDLFETGHPNTFIACSEEMRRLKLKCQENRSDIFAAPVLSNYNDDLSFLL